MIERGILVAMAVSALGAVGGIGFRIAYLRSIGKAADEIRHDLVTSLFALILNVLLAQYIAHRITSDFTGQAIITALVVGSGIGIANAAMERLSRAVSGPQAVEVESETNE